MKPDDNKEGEKQQQPREFNCQLVATATCYIGGVCVHNKTVDPSDDCNICDSDGILNMKDTVKPHNNGCQGTNKLYPL